MTYPDVATHTHEDDQPKESSIESELGQLTPTELYARRQTMLGELGHLELEFERRRSQKRRLARASDLVWKSASEMNPTKADIELCQIVSPELGFDILNMHMFRIRIPPGAQGGKYHRHGDAIKYYVSGRAVEYVGDEVYEVEAGDYIHIPANVLHGTQNPYDEVCEILAVQQFPGTYSQLPAPFMWGS